jgi:hypothetical protein
MTGKEVVSEKPSLYDRLGGVYSIATVVEDLIDRIMVDPRLNANPLVDEAHHKVPPARVQISGDGDAVLGGRWAAALLGAQHGRVAPTSGDHSWRVASVHGRRTDDPGQIMRTGCGAG